MLVEILKSWKYSSDKNYILFFTERSSEWSFGCHLDLISGQWEGRILQKWPMRGKETCPILSSAILMVFAAFFWIFYVFADKMQRFGQTSRRPLTSWEWPEFTNERTDSSVLANQQQGHVSLCDSVLKMLKGCWLVILFQRSRDIKITLLLMVTRTISLESVKYF